MGIGVTLSTSLFGIALVIAGLVIAVRKVEEQLKQMSGTFKNIDEKLSKIVKHLERIDETDEN